MTPTVVKTTRARPWRERLGEGAPSKAMETPADPSAAFAEYVRERVRGPVLRYAQRVAFLKEAGRRGVGRFEANLVIASVLHGRGMGQEYELRPERRSGGWRGVLVTAGMVQAAVLGGAWWVWH